MKNAFLITVDKTECIVRKTEGDEGFEISIILYLDSFETEVTLGYQDDEIKRNIVYDGMELGGIDTLKSIVSDLEVQVNQLKA